MSTQPSKLEKLIAEAYLDVRRAADRLKQAEVSGLKEAIRPIRAKFNAASKKHSSLQSLLRINDDRMKEVMEHAAYKNATADKLESRSPAKAKALRSDAKAIEKRYLLWCDHHGKAPTLLAALKPKEVVPPLEAQPKVQTSKRGRGGKRDGAGRPALGHVQLLFKCSPGTAAKARKFSKSKGVTLGGWLDSIIDSVQ
jgi:hypothetical protein